MIDKNKSFWQMAHIDLNIYKYLWTVVYKQIFMNNCFNIYLFT